MNAALPESLICGLSASLPPRRSMTLRDNFTPSPLGSRRPPGFSHPGGLLLCYCRFKR